MMTPRWFSFIILTLLCILWKAPYSTYAFSIVGTTSDDTVQFTYLSTVSLPASPKEKTFPEHPTRHRESDTSDEDGIYEELRRNNDPYRPLEYLQDRDIYLKPNNLCHILLLGITFTKTGDMKITIPYVADILTYALYMPKDEATKKTQHAKTNGMSCLGTWKRQGCLFLARYLQGKDLEVRVVPYCKGGEKGWQKNHNVYSDNSASSLG